MKLLRKLNPHGDTIVEVLIVLAILGLSFGLASATATRGLSQARNAEEHSEALGILSSQIEMLRSAVTNQIDVFASPGGGKPFCMTSISATNLPGSPFTASYSVPADSTSDTLNTTPTGPYPAACEQNGLYFISVVYTPVTSPTANDDYFTLRVRWDGVGSLGRQQELMVYRTHQLTADNGSGLSLPAPPTNQIKVNPLAVQPQTITDTPKCPNKNGAIPESGVGVTLNQIPPSGTLGPIISGPLAIFSPVTPGTMYQANVTSTPPGFTACPPGKSNPTVATTGTTPIPLYVLPQSWEKAGSQYFSCAEVGSRIGDGNDGCFGFGPNFYAFRNFKVTYTLAPPASATGSGQLSIGYGQFGLCDSSYNFDLQVTVGSSGPQVASLPMCDTSFGTTVTIPAGASTLTLEWTNNNFTPRFFFDANLMIKSVQLYYK